MTIGLLDPFARSSGPELGAGLAEQRYDSEEFRHADLATGRCSSWRCSVADAPGDVPGEALWTPEDAMGMCSELLSLWC